MENTISASTILIGFVAFLLVHEYWTYWKQRLLLLNLHLVQQICECMVSVQNTRHKLKTINHQGSVCRCWLSRKAKMYLFGSYNLCKISQFNIYVFIRKNLLHAIDTKQQTCLFILSTWFFIDFSKFLVQNACLALHRSIKSVHFHLRRNLGSLTISIFYVDSNSLGWSNKAINVNIHGIHIDNIVEKIDE